MKLSITLPFPPTVNTYWRHIIIGRSPRVLLSARGREYREAVGLAVLQHWPRRQPLIGSLDVLIVVNPPDRRTRDLDNLGKGILDGLAHAGVYENDSQIDRLTYERSRQIGKPGSVEVTLAVMETTP